MGGEVGSNERPGTKSVTIRDATRDDLETLFALFHLEYSETKAAEAMMPYRIEDIIYTFLRAMDEKEFGFVLVAEREGKIVGYLLGLYMYGWAGNLDDVIWHEVAWYVLPACRNRGYGLALYKAAEDRIVSDGIATAMCVSTAVGVNHEVMLDRYKRAGYVPLQIMSFKKIREANKNADR